MSRRMKLHRKVSRRSFSRGAQRVHPRNKMDTMPMRGGIRL